MSIVIKRSQRDYTLAFKLSVVDQVEKGELSYADTKALWHIGPLNGICLVKEAWPAAKANSRLWNACHSPIQTHPRSTLKQMETQLDEANARLFEAMLDVIREEYGVKLPKPLPASARKKKLFE
jgi:transposase